MVTHTTLGQPAGGDMKSDLVKRLDKYVAPRDDGNYEKAWAILKEVKYALSRPNLGADIELLDEVARLRKALSRIAPDDDGRDRLEIIADLVAERKKIYDMEVAQRAWDADQFEQGREDGLEEAARDIAPVSPDDPENKERTIWHAALRWAQGRILALKIAAPQGVAEVETTASRVAPVAAATVGVPSEAAVFWARAVINQQKQRMADLDYSAELYIGPVNAAEIILRLAAAQVEGKS